MANSSFNQSQVSSASEAGIGSVKLATQAQVDAGLADDGGVPIVVIPSRMLKNMSGFLAGEPITKGDALQVGSGTDSGIELFRYDNGTGGTLNYGVTPTTWIAQKFIVPTGRMINGLAFYIPDSQGNSKTVRLRSSLTGPDLATGSVTPGSSSGNTFRNIGFTEVPILDGGTYYAIFHGNSTPYNATGSTVSNYPDGEAWLSTDAGVNWVAHPTVADFYLIAYGGLTRTGKLYRLDTNNKLSFVGFATATVTLNDECFVSQAPFHPHFSGLTPGVVYYFNPSNGVNRGKLTTGQAETLYAGIAVNATTLVRLF